MPRKSTVDQMPDLLRDALNDLIREGRHSINEILDHLAQLNGGVKPVSRSALGRYAQQAESQMQKYREAQEVAKVWIGKLESEPDGDVARLLPEMMRTLAFQTIGTLSEEDKGVAPQDLMLLAKALDHLGKASGANVAIELKLREIRAKAKEAAADVVKQAKAGGLSDELAEQIRQRILGVAA